MPISQDRVHRAIPVPPEVLTLAEGQIVENAGGEAVIQIQLRKTPVELLGSRERTLQGAGVGAQAVGHARIEGARPRIAEQCIETMPGALGLSLYLQRVIASIPYAVVAGNGLKKSCKWKCSKTATQGVAADHTARAGLIEVFVFLTDENVLAVRAGVSDRQHNVPGQLALNVKVILLNHSLLEIEVRGLNGPGVAGWIHRPGQDAGRGTD